MSGRKYSIRYRFLSIWQIAENEAWFSEMSARGFHLHSIRGFLATFQQGEPAAYIYTIEPREKGLNNAEKLILYEDAGWELVTQVEQLQIFRAPAQAQVKAIHTDPGIYLEFLQERKKALFKSTLLVLLIGFLYIAFALYRFSVMATFLGFLFFVPYLFIWPNIFTSLADYYYLHRYYKNKQLQKQIKTDYQQAIRKRKFIKGTIWLLELLYLGTLIFLFFQAKDTKPLTAAPAYLLTLEDVYSEENLTTPPEGIKMAKKELSTVKSLRFTWIDYADHATKDGKYVFIYGNTYVAKNVSAARQMVRAIVQHWRKWPHPYTVREYTGQLENPGFDELFLTDNYMTNGGVIIARQGNYVYDISFVSDGQLVLDALYNKVSKLY